MTMRFPAGPAAVPPDVLAALGWDGRRLIHARVLSAWRLVVCELNEIEHDARLSDGLPPAADPPRERSRG
ncbi:hypothetical protein AB0B45_16675 [Nonomuraea sp. NPDC049152]|uniref:hypothetical protein n=1 Tax=Nonomuraea sp. NPDC049152 TaxID=3154350 RepID=UPI0033C48B15